MDVFGEELIAKPLRLRATMEHRSYQNGHRAQYLRSYGRAAPRRGQVLQLHQEVNWEGLRVSLGRGDF